MDTWRVVSVGGGVVIVALGMRIPARVGPSSCGSGMTGASFMAVQDEIMALECATWGFGGGERPNGCWTLNHGA